MWPPPAYVRNDRPRDATIVGSQQCGSQLRMASGSGRAGQAGSQSSAGATGLTARPPRGRLKGADARGLAGDCRHHRRSLRGLAEGRKNGAHINANGHEPHGVSRPQSAHQRWRRRRGDQGERQERALITARHAVEQGRDIHVPANVDGSSALLARSNCSAWGQTVPVTICSDLGGIKVPCAPAGSRADADRAAREPGPGAAEALGPAGRAAAHDITRAMGCRGD